MTESDYVNFCECWSQACAGIGKEPTSKQIEWAFEVLKDKELDEIKRALIMNARNKNSGQFHPKPADIIREIDGSDEDKKAFATAAFTRMTENVNRYATLVFDDPAIHYAFAVGFASNWQSVCDWDGSIFECQQQKRDFEKAYASFKHGMAYPKKMVGIEEMENGKKGIAYSKIIYIGDKQKALSVENNTKSCEMKHDVVKKI